MIAERVGPGRWKHERTRDDGLWQHAREIRALVFQLERLNITGRFDSEEICIRKQAIFKRLLIVASLIEVTK